MAQLLLQPHGLSSEEWEETEVVPIDIADRSQVEDVVSITPELWILSQYQGVIYSVYFFYPY